jgi:hypothetical protein
MWHTNMFLTLLIGRFNHACLAFVFIRFIFKNHGARFLQMRLALQNVQMNEKAIYTLCACETPRVLPQREAYFQMMKAYGEM